VHSGVRWMQQARYLGPGGQDLHSPKPGQEPMGGRAKCWFAHVGRAEKVEADIRLTLLITLCGVEASVVMLVIVAGVGGQTVRRNF